MGKVRGIWRRALGGLASAALLLAALAGPALAQPEPHGAPAPPTVWLSPDGKTAHLSLRVLTYNIEGLAWPIKVGRDPQLAEIGRRLAALREAGEGPDVVLFQEVFSPAAARALRDTGYPERVRGPSPWKRRDLPANPGPPGRQWRKGELGFALTSSGLAVASRFPIAAHKAEPFSRGACAGLDCLSNKGALFVRLSIPGVPEPVELFDSHLNSSRHARVSRSRALLAHRAESQELADFIAARHTPDAPMVLAGDFNSRRQPARFASLDPLQPLTLVHRYCLAQACEMASPLTGPAPWLDTEDLQFFRAGRRVSVRPVAMASLFDGKAGGPVLSDHAGLLVTYDLSWPVDEVSALPASP